MKQQTVFLLPLVQAVLQLLAPHPGAFAFAHFPKPLDQHLQEVSVRYIIMYFVNLLCMALELNEMHK